MWRVLLKIALLGLVLSSGGDEESGIQISDRFNREVDRRLNLPEAEQQRYAVLLRDTLAAAGLQDLPSEYVVLVDRDPFIQAVMIFWKSAAGPFLFIGASPASTGKPGQFEHFETPTGVYRHSVDNPDFRAEGTRNEWGIRGYGLKGMRIYDFGWLSAPKGWGDKAESVMRLQMHATDPDLLEGRLGSAQSKGCIRVPATFNTFVDRYGILDADYERATGNGQKLFVLSPKREPTRWSGEYLVVIDSKSITRPGWSPAPRL